MQIVIMGLMAGLAVGLISGMVGIGGGPLIIPILLYIFKANMHSASGTSLAIIIPTALVGVYTHFTKGSVDWRLAALIAAGSIIGSAIGSQFAYLLSGATLKKVFATVLLIVSLSILIDAFGISFTRKTPEPVTAAAEVSATKDH